MVSPELGPELRNSVVCTLEPEETTEAVEFFLREQNEVCLEDGVTILPEECAELVDESGFLKTLPHRHRMDGFFATRFGRKG